VGEGGDEVSVARFIADQRTNYRVPHTLTCALLGVSTSWFYKWLARTPTRSQQRRAQIDAAVADAFKAARGLHGSPRLHADLREAGWQVSEKTVADSMRRQGLIARRIRRRNGLTRQDKTASKFPDLLKRDFTATAPNARWVGDMTEIPTAAGKLYLATVLDLFSRRLLGAATGLHPDAELACAAITMAVAARGGAEHISGVVFHTDSARPTPPRSSPPCAAGWVSASPWAGSAPASTTPRPRRSSPAWSGRCCPGTTSTPPRPHERP
jgi:putative transposase